MAHKQEFAAIHTESIAGLIIGFLFGYAMQRGRFCVVAGIGNWLMIRDDRQLSSFFVASILAVSGTQLLEIFGIVPIGSSTYRNIQFDWLGVIVGGVTFGIGATLAGGCAVRTLIRTAEGSLHALFALLALSIMAAVTQYGYLEEARISLTNVTAIDVAGGISLMEVLHVPHWLLLTVLASSGITVAWYYRKIHPVDTRQVYYAALVGLCVILGWLATGVSWDVFSDIRPESVTITGPLAGITYSAAQAVPVGPGFESTLIFGVFSAAFVSAWLYGDFRIQPVSACMTVRAVIGGGLMGMGAVLAHGCNIGQGLTGVSTLSLESLLAVACIAAGVGFTVKMMEKYS